MRGTEPGLLAGPTQKILASSTAPANPSPKAIPRAGWPESTGMSLQQKKKIGKKQKETPNQRA